MGVVGAGASGCATAWSLAQDDVRAHVEVTIFHDESEVGGHSKTINVWFDGGGVGHVDDAVTPAPAGTTVYPVDIGVQFVCPTVYPNLYKMLKDRPEMSAVKLTPQAELKLSGAFSPTMNWGNFPAYQSGPRFDACYDALTKKLAEDFQDDIHYGPFTPLDGISFSTAVERYLEVKHVGWDTNFFRFLLIPYLSIINGYGTSDLLQTTFEDLFPLFTKIPVLQDKGPYGNFLEPGRGWDRFTDGATSWCAAMAAYASTYNATFQTSTWVLRVSPRADGKVVVVTAPTADVRAHEVDPTHVVPETEHVFDEVVLTTDMTTNRMLLDNAANGLYPVQKDYITQDKFALIPGVCYIHQDDECLSPDLRDKLEDGQFVGSYAWDPANAATFPYGMPYDLGASFQTYLMKNILGTPFDCHVSMYARDDTARRPDPAKVIYKKEWRHGRWVASFFDQAKRELHRIQGVGHIWFAGNNTTIDSEEGALISGMVIANKIDRRFVYPFDLTSEAFFFFEYFQNTMFPKRSFPWVLGQAVADAEEHINDLLNP
ncbi:MAG: NAD(P)-binding protein [Sandaracinaceae bacterium]